MQTEIIEITDTNPYLIGYNAVVALLMLLGSAIMISWLIKTRLGTNSLKDSKPRDHHLNVGVVLVVFGIWMISGGIASKLIYGYIYPDMPVGQDHLFNSIGSAVSGIIAILACLLAGRNYFEKGISGLGLSRKGIAGNLAWGFVNFMAIWPCVVFVVLMLAWLGTLIVGPKFQMPQHNLIHLLAERDSTLIQIFILAVAILVAPIVEELLFRGIFQSMLRKNLGSPWLSIILTSIFFAAVHGSDIMLHWPALFVLSCCMGYAYEKSGSLVRSMTVHAVFNASSVLSALFLKYFVG